jgi:hypothetical protein
MSRTKYFRAAPGTALTVITILLLAACGGSSTSPGPSPTPTPTPGPVSASLVQFVTGLNQPVALEIADGGSGRMFAVEQRGTIQIIS